MKQSIASGLILLALGVAGETGLAESNQQTKGDCSPTIARTGGNVKIVISGCKGVPAETVVKWQNELTEQYRALQSSNASNATALLEMQKELKKIRKKYSIDSGIDPASGNYEPETNRGKQVDNRFVRVIINSLNVDQSRESVTMSITVFNKSDQDILILFVGEPRILGNDGAESNMTRSDSIKWASRQYLYRASRHRYTRILGKGSATVNLRFRMSKQLYADYVSLSAQMAIYDRADPTFPVEFGAGISEIRVE